MANKSVTEHYLDKYLEIHDYFALGFSVIPLQPKGKLPLIKWKTFILPRQAIQGYVDRGCNWGICGGLLPSGKYLYFIDLDSKSMLPSIYELLPAGTPTVSTSRGFHLYLTWNEPVKTRRLEGIEIRGEGAYVVAPPSVHPSGHHYKFIRPLRMPPLMDPGIFIPPPSPFSTEGKSSWGTEDAFDWKSKYNGVKEGSRHNRLLQYLGMLHNSGKSEIEALEMAIEWNKRCEPPEKAPAIVSTLRKCWETWGKAR